MTYYTTEYSLVVLAQCLKITEKVAFNIASEASYVYIFIKNTKNGQFGEFYIKKNLSYSVTRQVNFNRTKIDEKCPN